MTTGFISLTEIHFQIVLVRGHPTVLVTTRPFVIHALRHIPINTDVTVEMAVVPQIIITREPTGETIIVDLWGILFKLIF
jgi:hypothetical protein